MSSGFRIDRPHPSKLVVVKSRSSHMIGFFFGIAFFAVWYGILLGESLSSLEAFLNKLRDISSSQPWLWFFILVPLLSVRQLWKSLIIALHGENIVFDSADLTVSKSGQKLATFSEIRVVDIKKVSGEHTDYYLSLILKDGRS